MPVSNSSRRCNRPFVGNPRSRIIPGISQVNNVSLRLVRRNVSVVASNDVAGHPSNKIVCTVLE